MPEKFPLCTPSVISHAIITDDITTHLNFFHVSYEIQLEPHIRSLGLGKHIMMILEALTTRLNLTKVVLTVFKHNPKALTFFRAIG